MTATDKLIRWAVVLFFAAVVVRSAWLSDDAYITFRTVDNFRHGYGLTWNVDERVQAYTHPLWMLVLIGAHSITNEVFYSTLGLSVGLSVVVVAVVVFALAQELSTAVWAGLALTLSKAFVDYATSGLENPLSHLLLLLFLWLFFTTSHNERKLFRLSLLAALGLLTRLDLMFLFLPPLLWELWHTRTWRGAMAFVDGFIPLVLWELFSVIYYGFPLPNTAYAKAVSTGIPAAALWAQGVLYVRNSLHWDPLTLTAVALAVLLVLVRREGRQLAVAVGMGLYFLYVLQVGGDFMSGRFFTVVLLTAVVLFVTAVRPKEWGRLWRVTAVGAVIVLGLLAHFPTPFNGGDYGQYADDSANWIDGDIADERMYYYSYTGLLNPNRLVHPWREQGEYFRLNGPAVIEHSNVGFLGYYAGPGIHILDRNALTDPLLARLPIANPADWRIGHFRRDIPAGYTETLTTGQNVIQDPAIAALYDRLTAVTRGDLWRWERFKEIWWLNVEQLAERPFPLK